MTAKIFFIASLILTEKFRNTERIEHLDLPCRIFNILKRNQFNSIVQVLYNLDKIPTLYRMNEDLFKILIDKLNAYLVTLGLETSFNYKDYI